MWLLTSVVNFLIGKGSDIAASITKQIVDLKVAQANAKTEQEKNQIAGQIAVLEAQKQVLMNEDAWQRKLTSAGRLLFVVPAGIIVWKLLVWDNTICRFLADPNQPSCVTEKLSADVWWLITIPIGFLFLQNISSVLKR